MAAQDTAEDRVDGIMEMVPAIAREWRYRWCEASGGCACVGCINQYVGRKITRDEWHAWVRRHDRRLGPPDRRR